MYRARRKVNNANVSVFTFEKNSIKDKKQRTQDAWDLLKKDPVNLTKFRHPSMLNLIEQPMEDNKIIVFVTEPVVTNLATLVSEPSARQHVPTMVDLKCIVLELMELVNFLHANAKTLHLNLSPENLYITAEGKLRVGGLNFI